MRIGHLKALPLLTCLPLFIATAFADSPCPGFAKLLPIADAPESPAEFAKKLSLSAKALTNEEGYAFLAEPIMRKEMDSFSKQLRQFSRYATEEDLDLKKVNHLQTVALNNTPGYGQARGGFVLWKNEIIPLDYFRKMNELHGAEGSAKALSAAANQPYFRWNPGTKNYDFHKSGADARILAHFSASVENPASVSLFRGTTHYEALLLQFDQALTKNSLPPDWRMNLKNALEDINVHARNSVKSKEELVKDGFETKEELAKAKKKLEAAIEFSKQRLKAAEGLTSAAEIRAYFRESLDLWLRQSQFGGLFTTPDAARAAAFSKGQVVEFRTSIADLENLRASGQLYVGMEKIGDELAVEMAFLPEQKGNKNLIDKVFQSFHSAKAVDEGNLFH